MVNHLLETSHPPLSSSALSLCASAADPAFHSSPFFTSLHHYLLTSSFPYTLPSSVSRKSFVCRSYENTRGVWVFFPFWNWSSIRSARHTCPHSSQRFCVFNRPRDFAERAATAPFS